MRASAAGSSTESLDHRLRPGRSRGRSHRTAVPSRRGGRSGGRPAGCPHRGSRGSACRCRESPAPRGVGGASAPVWRWRRDSGRAHVLVLRTTRAVRLGLLPLPHSPLLRRPVRWCRAAGCQPGCASRISRRWRRASSRRRCTCRNRGRARPAIHGRRRPIRVQDPIRGNRGSP